jgi:hypothetical protein
MGLVLAPGPEAIAVGLLMRARALLRANAALADRMRGGAADPITRAILEIGFTAGWLLSGDDDAESRFQQYIGQHTREWGTIARARQQRGAPTSPQIQAELNPFLDPVSAGLPPAARVPSFEDQAKFSGLGEFYGVYRMACRLVHPNLDAAMTGLVEVPDGFTIRDPSFGPGLGGVWMEVSTYIVARTGMLVDERLGWNRATELRDLLESITEAAREVAAISGAEP